MRDLSKLNNIGKVLEEQLNQVGIETFEQLKEIGSKEAWLRIKKIDDSACIHRLCALEGAIRGIKKSDLPDEDKKDLKEFYNSIKGKLAECNNHVSNWIGDYCMTKLGAEKDFKAEWNATRYMVGGKMFAMQGEDKNGIPIFTMKLSPDFGDFLRQQYKSITPGYYMNKVHWNSLYFNDDVPEDIVKNMIDDAYSIVFKSLSQKLQKEIKNY